MATEPQLRFTPKRRMIIAVCLLLFLFLSGIIYFEYSLGWIKDYYEVKRSELPEHLRKYTYYFSSEVDKVRNTIAVCFLMIVLICSTGAIAVSYGLKWSWVIWILSLVMLIYFGIKFLIITLFGGIGMLS